MAREANPYAPPPADSSATAATAATDGVFVFETDWSAEGVRRLRSGPIGPVGTFTAIGVGLAGAFLGIIFGSAGKFIIFTTAAGAFGGLAVGWSTSRRDYRVGRWMRRRWPPLGGSVRGFCGDDWLAVGSDDFRMVVRRHRRGRNVRRGDQIEFRCVGGSETLPVPLDRVGNDPGPPPDEPVTPEDRVRMATGPESSTSIEVAGRVHRSDWWFTSRGLFRLGLLGICLATAGILIATALADRADAPEHVFDPPIHYRRTAVEGEVVALYWGRLILAGMATTIAARHAWVLLRPRGPLAASIGPGHFAVSDATHAVCHRDAVRRRVHWTRHGLRLASAEPVLIPKRWFDDEQIETIRRWYDRPPAETTSRYLGPKTIG